MELRRARSRSEFYLVVRSGQPTFKPVTRLAIGRKIIIGLRNFPKHTWSLLMNTRSGRQVDSCLLLASLILPFCALEAQTSSSLDHFSWSTPPSTVQAGQPLAVV